MGIISCRAVDTFDGVLRSCIGSRGILDRADKGKRHVVSTGVKRTSTTTSTTTNTKTSTVDSGWRGTTPFSTAGLEPLAGGTACTST